MKDRPQVQDFDWTLLAIVAAICALGVMEIYSSTHASAMTGMHWKQLMWLGIGIAGMFLISRIDYHTLLDQAPILYMCGLAGLLVVMVIGSTHLGAKRWISLGGIFNLQVSELMKLIIIIVLARYFSEVRTDRLTLPDLVTAGLRNRHGPAARCGGGCLYRRNRMEASSHRSCSGGIIDPVRLEYAASFEAVPAAAN
jgi:cell division protein FtsW (lipid II flippase)